VSRKSPHLQELGQFLKARRSELTPTDLGLPTPDPRTRRVAGLRREEVAAAVAITAGEHSISDLAEMFSISRPTVYRALERARTAVAAQAGTG
jgi:DNA-directed RNA polymerase specialized sigma24 family protein